MNPNQENTFGDYRGDACEDVYFYDNFENGIDRWTRGDRTEWTTSAEAAVGGEMGLVDREGLSLPNLNTFIDTPSIDLSNAFLPRVWFQGRFDLVDNGFFIDVLVDELRLALPGASWVWTSSQEGPMWLER